jgi:hypothetical protein
VGTSTILRIHAGGSLYNDWWSSYVVATARPSLANGAWHHVAITGNSTTRATWLNGTMIAFDRPSASTHIVPSPVTNTYLGATYAAPTMEYFYGWMDEVRVWSVARTGAQLRAGMYAQLPSSTSGMVGQWHFDEGYVMCQERSCITCGTWDASRREERTAVSHPSASLTFLVDHL